MAIQRSPGAGANAAMPVPPVVDQVLRSPGQPLDHATRNFMEAGFGHDFSDVRIHTGTHADRSARAIKANAYTAGKSIVFDSQAYSPETSTGKKLIAHELAHVIQQAGSTTSSAHPSMTSSPLDPAEREAEQAADSVMRFSSASILGRSSRLQRHSYVDCSEDDIDKHIRGANLVARNMVRKAISVLWANPIHPKVTALFPLYFKATSPSISDLLKPFNKIDDEFDDDDYTYECEDDCDENVNAYTRKHLPWARIHLCMESGLRNWTHACIARAIIHEFLHRYAGLSDNLYCNHGCGCHPCGSALSAEDALENCDSYACFALAVYSLSV